MAEAGIALEVTEGQCSELAAGGDSLWVCSNGQASGSKCIMQCQEGFMNSGSAVQMTCACRNGYCEWKSNNEFRVRNLFIFFFCLKIVFFFFVFSVNRYNNNFYDELKKVR